MRGSRGGGRGSGPPLEKTHQKVRFLSNIGPDPLKNHKANKPAFNVGRSSVRQPFRWRAEKGPLIVVFGPFRPPLINYKNVKVAIILKRTRKLFALLLLSYICIATINVLPHGAVGWSAVCYCGIS